MAGLCAADIVAARIRAEYREMPGLCLTLPQAVRLFNLDPAQCAQVMNRLVVAGALRTNGRQFCAASAGRCAAAERMAAVAAP